MSRKSVVFGLFRLVITWILPLCSTIKSRLLSPGGLTRAVGLSKRSPGNASKVAYWCGSKGSAREEFASRLNSPAKTTCRAVDSTRQRARNKRNLAIVYACINTRLEYKDIARLCGKRKFCLAGLWGGWKIGARTAMSARSWHQIKFARTRLSV